MVHDANASFDGTPLLKSLTQAERDQLVRQCRFRRFAAGEHIIDGQSESRDVFFVIEGTVRVVNYSLSGREVALDDIPAGGFFGELAALDGGPRSAFVMAQGGEAVTAAMPYDVFLDLLGRKPLIGLDIMKRLARMVRQATERIMDLSTLGANNRVHAELLRQALSSPNDGQSAAITPIPLHADIASRVSTTRETVARVLNDLARSGIVERKKNSLVVRNISRLAMLVEDVRGN
ncbi:Crp/Fnr family transcriptional regulator [Telmatospirillum sp.]|uniref:Crp/Fnr family transcriptional regulator n=1 Tax=Telmatospirillum sp. TaxID=2079197 RepID=UPI002848C70D|nr:Crp/Fnr family transcriptional regulator [Telmatospirillum sp.]MDR3441369.1 Crp/Fnr family transcriptional regulator [Telmatospirillum sp.]